MIINFINFEELSLKFHINNKIIKERKKRRIKFKLFSIDKVSQKPNQS